MRTVPRRGIRAHALFQVALPLVVLIALVGGLVYWRARTALDHATRSDLQNLKLALRDLVETSYQLTQRRVQTNLEYLARTAGDTATVDPDHTAAVTVTDQLSGARTELRLPALAIGGTAALGNNALLDDVSARVGGTATLFQLIPGGMLRVATSVRKADGQRATLTYIPASSPVYQAVAAGRSYDGRAMVAGEWSVTSYRPVRNAAGQVVAALFAGLPQTRLDELRERLARFRVGDHGFVQILDADGKQIVHPDHRLEGQLRTDPEARAMLAQRDGRVVTADYVYELAAVPEMSWLVVVGASRDDLDAPLATMRWWLAAVLVTGVALAYLLSSRFAHRLARSLGKASAMMRDIASGAGDLTRRLADGNEREVSELAAGFNGFVTKLQGTVREVASSAVSVSSSSRALSRTAADLDGAMGRLRARATQIAASSAGAAGNLDTVSGAASEFSTSLTAAASAIEQLGGTIRSVSASCREESRITAVARAKASETTGVVSELHTAAREVGQVVDVIQRIANQTHLLSLNATIEAASAGAAGKGFRIVADEVRALAQQTAEATQQIQQWVSRMLAEATRATTTMGDISDVIERVDTLSTGIETLLDEQTLAVGEISRTVSGLDDTARAIAVNVASSAGALAHVKTESADVDHEVTGAAEQQRALRLHLEQLAGAAHELEMVAGSFRT
jgi:methyl-accepting chemotaxis protein